MVSTPNDMRASARAALSKALWGHPIREYGRQLEAPRPLADPLRRGHNVVPGNGSPVRLVPGFLSGDPFVLMRSWLRRMGHRTYRAGTGLAVDCADRSVQGLDMRVADVAGPSGGRIHVLTHSRGGLFVRPLSRRDPEHIAQVITLGSPLGATFYCSVSVAAAVAGARASQRLLRSAAQEKVCFTSNCSCGCTSHLSGPLTTAVPLTSIYTVEDGIVRARACVVPDATCLPVRGAHLGRVMNVEVYRHVGRLLGERSGAVMI